MVTWHELRTARREGSLAAQRTRRRLGLTEIRRVNIFKVIDDDKIWLMFQPLSELYGFYRRLNGNTGIVLNAGHPTGLQRYTAAHEYGHHILGHAFSLDEEPEIGGASGVGDANNTITRSSSPDTGNPLQEAAAQAFAATFLMPVQMVNRALIDLGLDRDTPQLSPPIVYSLSLEFGTSYEAMLSQLAVLEKVSWAAAARLKIPPIRIKTILTGGRRPPNSRADVWVVDYGHQNRSLQLNVGDEVIVRLTETPSSGYAWEVAQPEGSVLEAVHEQLEAIGSDKTVLGSSAQRDLHFRAISPGAEDITARLARPWETRPAAVAKVHVAVVGAPTGDEPQGLLLVQQRRFALAA